MPPGWRNTSDQSHLPQHAHAPEHPVFSCLRQHPQVTAILAINDASAIRTWALLQQGGLCVPDDISLIGFDDTDPVLDAHGQNMLTTVRLPLREFGEMAARQMIDFVQGAPLNRCAWRPGLIVRAIHRRRIRSPLL